LKGSKIIAAKFITRKGIGPFLEKKEDPKTEQLHGSKSETGLTCN